MQFAIVVLSNAGKLGAYTVTGKANQFFAGWTYSKPALVPAQNQDLFDTGWKGWLTSLLLKG